MINVSSEEKQYDFIVAGKGVGLLLILLLTAFFAAAAANPAFGQVRVDGGVNSV